MAFKKMTERRFKRFECDIQEGIAKERYDEYDFKNVKDLKRVTEDITDVYEEIITYLDSVYSEHNQQKRTRR